MSWWVMRKALDARAESVLKNNIFENRNHSYGGNTHIFLCHGSMVKKNLKFLEFLNCYHPTIKFTINYTQEEINFLDVSVRKKSNQLVTDLYIKPTDMHQYLHASSSHIYHSKKSIPYS